MRINREQIRAARGLLNWPTRELAERAGLTVQAINNIENGRVDPHAATMDALETVFMEAGIEFLPNSGLKRRDDNIMTFEGKGFYLNFLNYVFMRMNGSGEVLFINVEDTLSSPEIVTANMRLRESGVKCRYLCPQSPKRLDYDRRDYRGIPDDYFRNGVQIIFKDNLATLARGQFVHVIRNQDVADGARQLFELVWHTLEMPKVPAHA